MFKSLLLFSIMLLCSATVYADSSLIEEGTVTYKHSESGGVLTLTPMKDSDKLSLTLLSQDCILRGLAEGVETPNHEIYFDVISNNHPNKKIFAMLDPIKGEFTFLAVDKIQDFCQPKSHFFYKYQQQ